MAFVEFPGLPSLYQSGQNSGNYLAGVADKAADFACDLYRDYPGAIIQSPIGAFNRGLMDSLCGPRNKLPPSPDTPPFSGGQCQCVTYNVNLLLRSPTTGDNNDTVTVTGRVLGLSAEGDPSQSETELMYLRYIPCDGSGNELAVQQFLVGTRGNGFDVIITGVSRQDGLPDNCGNPGPDWDPNLPREIPDNRRSGNVVINNNDGTNIVLPIAIVGSGNVINVNPNINVDVGGINIRFDFSGSKIDFGNGNPNVDQPRDRNNPNSDDFDRIEEILNRINERINEQGEDIEQIKKDRNDTPPPDDDPEIEKEEDEEEEESGDRDVDKLQYVCVHLTKLPNREQWGDGAPNVYYAGWLEFKVKDCLLPRQPIHFSNSIFKAPEGATGFAYTLTNGAKGRVTVYKTKASD